jgi:hypothetical protein
MDVTLLSRQLELRSASKNAKEIPTIGRRLKKAFLLRMTPVWCLVMKKALQSERTSVIYYCDDWIQVSMW